jgi:hypothetical protein
MLNDIGKDVIHANDNVERFIQPPIFHNFLCAHNVLNYLKVYIACLPLS